MATLYPSTADGYDSSYEVVEVPGDGTTDAIVETGPKAIIDQRQIYWRNQSQLLGSNIASIAKRESGGRSTLTVTYAKTPNSFEPYNSEDGVQELNAVDVVRDIKCSDYFSTLTNAEMADVQNAWDSRLGPSADWNILQQSLYGHMAHGQEQYNETAYEFRQTFQTTNRKSLRKAASNPNTVQPLPELSQALQDLIDAMPAGEWLKKPTTVQSLGRKGWVVTQTYQWAKQWSVIYGGTFTGLD